MTDKILLSTDIGSDVDDALALLTMLNSGMNLRAIYTTNGDVNSRSYIAKHMINLSGRDIAVARGEAKPLTHGKDPYFFYENCHIDDSFEDKEESEIAREIKYLPVERAGIEPKGVDELVERLSKEKQVVFSIAPLTNIARVILEHPEAAKNILQLYVMGCRFPTKSSPISELEHNLGYDTEAAKIVFNSDVPITVVPSNLCDQFRMPIDIIGQLESDVGKYVKKMADAAVGLATCINLNRTQIGKYPLTALLTQMTIVPPEVLLELPRKDMDRLLEDTRKNIVNLSDFYWPAMNPEEYMQVYRKIIDNLKHASWNKDTYKLVAEKLESLIPRDLSISDVYVPYCYANRDRVRTVKGNIGVTSRGESFIRKGNKHTIVTEIDFEHFKEFLRQNIK